MLKTVLVSLGALASLAALPVNGFNFKPGGGFHKGQYRGPAGSRPYKLYVPSSYDGREPWPLVVALHGCAQEPDNLAAASRFNELAERQRFLVLYPQQTRQHNPGKCWNWFSRKHQFRGAGEPAIITGMVDQVRARYAVDSSRIYVFGVSAGGGMAATLAVCYPDYFAAVGIHSGAEYLAAKTYVSALLTMLRGGPDPADIPGLYANIRKATPVIVIHGSKDRVVNPVNADLIIKQFGLFFSKTGGQPAKMETVTRNHPPAVAGGYPYTVTAYQQNGRLLMQKVIVQGLDHAWSGGSKKAPANFVDPRGPDAALLFWDFFSQHALSAAPGSEQSEPDADTSVA